MYKGDEYQVVENCLVDNMIAQGWTRDKADPPAAVETQPAPLPEPIEIDDLDNADGVPGDEDEVEADSPEWLK